MEEKKFKNKVAISASRLDKFNECSMQYAARYLYKLPDKGNAGMFRGSVSHDVLEILAKNTRHEEVINEVISNKTCDSSPGLWRLINNIAKKYGVNDSENLDLINSFIYVGLAYQFHGPPGTVRVLTEQEFDFEVDERGVCYRLKGYIDKIFVINSGKGLYCEIRDFKSSKDKFEGEKISSNHQALIYQLAVRYLLPDIPQKRFQFIFLKFPDEPVQEIELYDTASLYGYELYLSEMQKKLNSFSIKNQGDNYAALDPKLLRMRCGKEFGLKKDGKPYFCCASRKPMKYYVQKKNGEIIKSAFTKEELSGEGIEEVSYSGCTYFYKDGKKRNLQ